MREPQKLDIFPLTSAAHLIFGVDQDGGTCLEPHSVIWMAGCGARLMVSSLSRFYNYVHSSSFSERLPKGA